MDSFRIRSDIDIITQYYIGQRMFIHQGKKIIVMEGLKFLKNSYVHLFNFGWLLWINV